MANAWRTHIKNTMKKNPKMMLKDVLRLASKTYKSVKKTATAVVPRAPKRKRRRTMKRKGRKAKRTKRRGAKKARTKRRRKSSKKRRTKRRRRR